MSQREAVIATRRFGLGAKPGDPARIPPDPRGYVLAALEGNHGAIGERPGLQPSHASFVALREAQKAQRDARAVAAMSGAEAGSAGTTKSQDDAVEPPPTAALRPGQVRREVMQEEAAARLQHAIHTDRPFLERLVMFWSNHFCVSAAKNPAVRVMAGAFEREAIRPYVLGRFADMLKAVEQHPAMLIYLDNQLSIGPNSQAGRNRARGLNENLAREILELHTLGVDGGYSQADVTNLAKIITGWTVANLNQDRGPPGRFFFAPARHEPGPLTLLGRSYEEAGVAKGEAALAELARRPATARHIARKLAVHFISDHPSEAVTANLEAAFRHSDGDLAVVARALVSAPEAWQTPARKIVPPYDFLVSLHRAFGMHGQPNEALRLTAALGQPLWQPPSPKGWPDSDDAWTAPSAIRERLRIAELFARDVNRSAALDPRAAADDLFGDALGRATRQAIARAETREQGLELLIMSPEFQRR
jgi:uncharacterized protein (DUF1800 family)